MEKGLRGKFLNMIKVKVESKLYFKDVKLQVPAEPIPSALALPSAFIFRAPEIMDELTNQEKRSIFGVHCILYVEGADDIELEKCRAEDMYEDALLELQTENQFAAAGGVMIRVTGSECGPLALAGLGFDIGVYPPYGAVRVMAEIEFDYQTAG